MASTNKTPHLGLCQWEATDPFLREDMNGDFAKIDAAVGRKSQLDLIKELTLSAQSETWYINTTDIQWSKYSLVVVKLLLQGHGSGVFSVYPASRQRGEKLGSSNTVYGMCSVPYNGRPIHIFFTPGGGEDEISALSVSATALFIGGTEGVGFNSITAFHIDPNSSGYCMSAGGKVQIWGVR